MITVRNERERGDGPGEELAALFERDGGARLGEGSGEIAHADRRLAAGAQRRNFLNP